MINTVLYNLSKNFYSHQLGKDVMYVAPGPVLADALRDKLLIKDAQVTTMAQFQLGLINEYLPADIGKNYQSKSQLLLTLGLAWRQIGAGNFAQFKNAFMLLTDLRSYTQDEVLLSSLLEEFDQTLGEIVLKMNGLMEVLGIVDEHAAYWKLNQALGVQDGSGLRKIFCFWGFDFLSPMQVDFLKTFSKHNDVYIPIPELVHENSVTTDWIQWLGDEAKETKLDETEVSGVAKVISFPKGYLSQALLAEISEESGSCDVFLASKQITSDEIQTVPSSDHFFKVSVQVFLDKLSSVDSDLKKLLSKKSKISLGEFKLLIAEFHSKALVDKNYLLVKIFQVYEEVTNRWTEITDQELSFDWFMSELLKEVVQLDLPRLSMLPLVKKSRGRIFGLKDLHSINLENKNYLCIASEMGNIKTTESSLYSNTAETKLLQIGPLRRAGLEELFTVSKLKELVAHDNSTVLIEEGTQERSQIWHDLLKDLSEQDSKLVFKQSKSNQLPSVTKGQEFEILDLTASKLQAYLNCPRKFYHDYLDGIFPKIKLVETLSPMHMGDIAHNLIEKLIKNHVTDPNELEQYLDRELKQFYEQNEIWPALDMHFEYLAGLRIKVHQVTNELFKLINFSRGNFTFEKKMEVTKNRIKRKGRYDFFLESDDIQILVDFKSSAYGIPNKKDLESYDVIQMWFYLSMLDYLGELSHDKLTLVGYVNLSKPDKSYFMVFGNGDLPAWLGEMQIFNKVDINSTPLIMSLEQYREFESGLIRKIHADKLFSTIPRTKDACTYCPLSVVCPKTAVGGEV